ncbi:MAG: electron transport complex protein RnfB [Gammaproteobacteria bacterium]|jgi:electron transport complex protein RnfB
MIELIVILILGSLFLFISKRLNSNDKSENHNSLNTHTIDAIEKLLPQTQCGKCHYSGCRPYAEAIVLGKADINQCPPGGEFSIRAIANLLGRESKPFSNNIEDDVIQSVALIDEDSCIGCVKCIKACPVDAILGAPKFMHTVIKKDCTGCELCIPSCPVDCISMVPLRVKTQEWVWPKPNSEHKLA